MDLEVREIPIQSRAMYNSRLKSYKQEVEKLEKDFVSTPAAPLPPLVPRLVCFVLLKKHKLYPISSQDELQMSDSHFFFVFFYCRKRWLHMTAWLSPSQTLLVLCSPSDKPAEGARAETCAWSSGSPPPRSSRAVLRVSILLYLFTLAKACWEPPVRVCFWRTWPRLVIHKSLRCSTWSLSSVKA